MAAILLPLRESDEAASLAANTKCYCGIAHGPPSGPTSQASCRQPAKLIVAAQALSGDFANNRPKGSKPTISATCLRK
jgi:hypothetical protein